MADLSGPASAARPVQALPPRQFAVPWIAVATPDAFASANPNPTGCHSPGSIATSTPPGRRTRNASAKHGCSGPMTARPPREGSLPPRDRRWRRAATRRTAAVTLT